MSAGEHDTNHDDSATGDMLDTEAGAGAGDADSDEPLDDEFKVFLTYIEAKARSTGHADRDLPAAGQRDMLIAIYRPRDNEQLRQMRLEAWGISPEEAEAYGAVDSDVPF